MALTAIQSGGQVQDALSLARPIKDNINQARTHRKPMEVVWQSNMAYAAGNVWLVADKNRQLRRIQEMDPRYRKRELYNAEIIGEYRTTILGELGSDDDRPELLLQRDDLASEDYQAQCNRAVAFGWDFEAHADEALAELDRLTVDLGTSAMRCRFDPTVGPVAAESVPHQNGKPLYGDQAVQAVDAAAQNGQTLDFKPIRQGKIVLEPISAFGILPPAGVTHERYFPFDCIVRPTPLAQVKAEFGAAASELKADGDIASTLGEAALGTGANPTTSKNAVLKGHVWLFTYYERPTAKNPKGRVFHFAGNKLELLRVENELPYRAPDGTYRSGITYFHWWRTTGRFWSRSLIEPMKDPARSISKRRMQMNEIIDKGLPWVMVEKGSESRKRTDLPLELIELGKGETTPTINQGIGPGPWMTQDIEQIREDVEHATGIRGPALGENPANVNTYSQLQLIKEGDQVKREVTRRERALGIAQIVENLVYDIRTYWGDKKQIMLAGDDDRAEVESFNATKIPAFFIVKPAKGSAKARSQGAEIQKIADLWQAALASGVVVTNPAAWMQWLKDSYEAGQARELPSEPGDWQSDKAERENHLLLGNPEMAGTQVPPTDYDNPQIHIPIHREAQVESEYSGDVGAWQRIEEHIQLHEQLAQAQAQQIADIQASAPAPPDGTAPGAAAPPAPGPPQSQAAPTALAGSGAP